MIAGLVVAFWLVVAPATAAALAATIRLRETRKVTE